MFADNLVKIPNVPGKIARQTRKTKAGATVYILYEKGRTYNPQKKYNVPERVCIGKLCTEKPELMYPNGAYFELFPEAIEVSKQANALRSCALQIGSFIVIDRILTHYKLKDIAAKWFGNDGGLFLDLAAYMIVSENNAGQYYPDYAFNHPLFTEEMNILSDSKVSRFLASITKDQIIGFLDSWNKGTNKRERIYLSYDSTNKNSQAGDLSIVEYGKPKDDKGLPIFNLSLAFDKTNQLPLFYEQYPGSITDVSQLKFLIDKVKEYGYSNVGFILDRGYFSRENIEYMDENKFPFVMMVKGCRPLVDSIVQAKKNSFESKRKCLIEAYRVYGTTEVLSFYGKQRYFHIYFSAGKMAAEREKLESKLSKMREEIKKVRGSVYEFTGQYLHYFNFHYNESGVLLFEEEKEEVIEKELNLCGYFCIVTSEKKTAEEAYLLYKGRDSSEKLFRADKTFLGSSSMRIHSNASLESKTLVEFTALVIRNRIYSLLKAQMLKLAVRRNYMTVPAAIKEMNKIEMVRTNEGKYHLHHAITKIQQIIFGSFGISLKDIQEEANKISEALDGSKDLRTGEDEEEEQSYAID